MENTEVFKAFEDMGFVVGAGKSVAFGQRFINVKRFNAAYQETREKLEEIIEYAQTVEEREATIIENARLEAARIIQHAEDDVNSMDVVQEAKDIARNIIENANEEARTIKEEAEIISNNAIEYGEKTKNKLIFQGYKFLKDKFSKNMEDMNTLLKGMEEVKTVLEGSYNEIDDMFKDEDESVTSESRKIS